MTNGVTPFFFNEGYMYIFWAFAISMLCLPDVP